MILTVEISMYPFTTSYLPSIDAFLEHLTTQKGIKIKINALSTQIQGEGTAVFNAIQSGVEAYFGGDHKGVFVMKVLPGHIDLEYRRQEG